MIKHFLKYSLLTLFAACFVKVATAQHATLSGHVQCASVGIQYVNVYIEKLNKGATTDSTGKFSIQQIPAGKYKVSASAIGYQKEEKYIQINEHENLTLNFELKINNTSLNEVVISGTMKEVSRMESPVPVEVYNAKYFKANPTPAIFDALQNINGVRPQLNCNICNTGDIHINGLEGPYTMILIDGMPIVSGLATVYGLNGIPQSLIERVEIVKGPASTLYGSEAVGGLVNIITKKPTQAPLFSVDVFATNWQEINTDLSGKWKVGNKAQSLLGVNYFYYQNIIDNNQDGFTDVTLQDRISIFNKWDFQRKHNRVFSIAGRYIYEDRWGGQTNWTKQFRGGDSIYGESIYTKRWELLGNYQLPFKEKMNLQMSATAHHQNSVYGNILYIAQQYIAFGQLTWNKTLRNHELLAGIALRYTFYDDNTPATAIQNDKGHIRTNPSSIFLPGVFFQDEIKIRNTHKVLLGMRYDYNTIHGNIFTPRINYKWNSINKKNIVRIGAGNGYRVANVFTEDHAALTGARKVEFLENIKPETSWNVNTNVIKKITLPQDNSLTLDATAFYTYFTNKIIADYTTDANKIFYQNLNGYAVSKGVSLNADLTLGKSFNLLLGATYMDVYSQENNIRTRQFFTERFTAVWNAGYNIKRFGISIDYTGNVYSPMLLPLLSEYDPRLQTSPWWSIQNIQVTKKINRHAELYGGIKNILDWTPNKGNPFLIARANDPFDKEVKFDQEGKAIATADNPYALTFDPTYMYAPNQGRRLFLGFRYAVK